jgi:hypothetical protein
LLYAAASFEAAGCDVRMMDYPGEARGWDALEADLRAFAPQRPPALHHDPLARTRPGSRNAWPAASIRRF